MGARCFASIRASAVVIAVVLMAVPPVAGQTAANQAKTTAPKASTSLRTADGHPDLEGTWSFATVTPLQRPGDLAEKEVLTDSRRRSSAPTLLLVEQVDVNIIDWDKLAARLQRARTERRLNP